MSNAFAIPLFYVIAAAIWAYFYITTPRQRDNLLSWFIIGTLCFGAVGFLYTLLSGQSVAPSGGP